MRIETPGLDRLTAEVKAQFFEGVTDPAFRMPDPSAGGHVLSRPTVRYLSGSPDLAGSVIDILLCDINGIDDIPTTGPEDDVRDKALRSAAHKAGISTDTAGEVLLLMRDVESAIRKLVVSQLDMYTGVEVGAVLADLFHIDYDQFDSADPANALDYNCDDYFPKGETPRDTLTQLTQETVFARLIKSAGRKLILAWVKAHEADEIAWAKGHEERDD